MKLKMRIPVWIILFLMFSKLWGQSISIWIDPKPGMTSCSYTSKSKKVWLLSGDSVPELITEISYGQSVQLKYQTGSVQVLREGLSLGSWPEVLFWAADSSCRFSLTPEGGKKTIEYYDQLKVQAYKNQLRMINIVWMENYICGVVAAEGGLYKTPEFLKVQAICSRTYAMRNMGKFVREGFDLTDKVDCQVYHGIPKNLPGVDEAVLATAGLIAVDEFGEPIDAVFSANCGGQSANSEDVWKATSSYLKSTESYDQYREFKNSSWTFTISRLDLLNLFSKYYKTPVTDWEVIPDASGRVKQIRLNQDPGLVLSGIEMRSLLKLKSTKFRLFEHHQQVFFSGQGFGHGVGMCQDGAYKLSTIGWTHESILRHFYQGVELLSIQEWLKRLATGKGQLFLEEATLPEP
jgi:stage II sporulation protein D